MDQFSIEKIYNDLQAFVVELEADPIVLGPSYLQDLISKTRGYLNTVSIYTQEAHRERHHLERDLDARQSAFDISADELLSIDNRVKHLPSIDDRKSMINLLLSTERREIEDLKRQIRSLGHVEKAVRHRQRELSATMSAIRLQRSLIQAELKTGSMYGDENEKSRGDAWGRTRSAPASEDIDEEELDKLLSSANQEMDDDAEEGAEEVAEAEPESEEPDLADFVMKGVQDTDEVIDTTPEPEPEEDPLVDDDGDDVTFETDEAITFEGAPEDDVVEAKEEPVEEPPPAKEEPVEEPGETGLELAEDLLVETASAPPEPDPEPASEPEEEDPAIARFLGDDETEDFSDIFDSL